MFQGIQKTNRKKQIAKIDHTTTEHKKEGEREGGRDGESNQGSRAEKKERKDNWERGRMNPLIARKKLARYYVQ